MVLISGCWMIVIVHRRAMVVIRVIVPFVFVDVQRGSHGRRNDQGLNEHECHDPAHGSSLLRPAEPTSGGSSRQRWWPWLGYPWKTLTGAVDVCILPCSYET